MYQTRGQTRRGQHRSARMADLPAGYVERRFDAGWAWLEIIDMDTGDEVGGIGRNMDTGQRVWWSQ